MMNGKAMYDHHCPRCNENTQHVPKHKGFMGVAIKVVKIIVFCVSFGMAFPHIFTEDDEIAVKCTKCGADALLSNG